MRLTCGPYLVVVMLTALTPARAAAQPTDTVVRAIQIVDDGGITRVTIAADSPLPLPRSGSLNDPPRIYFDLTGRMAALRGLVVRIDAGENVGSDVLASAAQQFAELRRNLEKVQPSGVLAVTHDLLMTACTFGAMASRFGIDAAQAESDAATSAHLPRSSLSVTQVDFTGERS